MRHLRLKEKRKKLLTVFLCMLTLLLLCKEKVNSAESTAYLDLKSIFEDGGQGFFAVRQDLLIEMLRTRVAQLSEAEEKNKVKKWIWDFGARGFGNDDYKYCLFRGDNQVVRGNFLRVVQSSDYRFDQEFLKDVYSRYASRPATSNFEVLVEPSWIDFSSKISDENTYQDLVRVLNTSEVSGDMERYLRTLYYGYRAYPNHSIDLDQHVRTRYLDTADFNPSTIVRLYEGLQQSYWSQLDSKKRWMLTKSAWRLYQEFSPQKWTELSPQILLHFAQLLRDAAPGPECQPVRIIEWLRKMMASL